MSLVQKECNSIINNIVTDTYSILQRPDPLQKQLVKELGIEFNIKLGEVNSETQKILADKSWRNRK